MDIFEDTIKDTTSLLEIDRFKARIMEIWSRMLEETYEQYYDKDNNISLILQKKFLVIGKSELDITDKIMKIVNEEIKINK